MSTKWTYQIDGEDGPLTLPQVRTLARSEASVYTEMLHEVSELTAADRDSVAPVIPLHEQVLELWVRIANVADDEHDLLSELLARQKAALADMERCCAMLSRRGGRGEADANLRPFTIH